MPDIREPAPAVKVEDYLELKSKYDEASLRLAEFGAGLIGYTVLFRRGKVQVVLAEVIGSRGTVLTIRNIESDATYFVDLTKTEIEKIGSIKTVKKI